MAYSRGLRVLSEGINIQMNSRMPHVLEEDREGNSGVI